MSHRKYLPDRMLTFPLEKKSTTVSVRHLIRIGGVGHTLPLPLLSLLIPSSQRSVEFLAMEHDLVLLHLSQPRLTQKETLVPVGHG